ncbi:hypothetical protein [Streptomyces sp. DHE17-7]|uniref:hypothetical protein n=1 Tax=Streptomyces sp. DHE17-7 TaxID=2759949 RepID=UPI003FA72CE1
MPFRRDGPRPELKRIRPFGTPRGLPAALIADEPRPSRPRYADLPDHRPTPAGSPHMYMSTLQRCFDMRQTGNIGPLPQHALQHVPGKAGLPVKLPVLRGRKRGAAVLALLPLLALTACGSGDTGPTAAVGAQASRTTTTGSSVVQQSGTPFAALLPADVRRSGTLRIGSSIGVPGGVLPKRTDRTDATCRQKIELAERVRHVSGVRLQRQDASFETILPALGSGKYDVGTGNFGVTTEGLGHSIRHSSRRRASGEEGDLIREGHRPHPTVRTDRRNRRRHHLRDHPHRAEGRVRRGRKKALEK